MRGTDYVLKRVFFAIVTVWVALTINFVLFRLAPGTAVTNLSRVPHATQQLRHALEVEFGLDKSKWQQYVIYLKQLAHGNLGISYENQQPVSTNLRIALVNTLPMVTLGTAFAIVFGIFTGVIAAWRRRTKTEGVSVSTALAFYAMPTQWLGLMLIIIFAGVFPTAGMTNEFLLNPPFWTHVKDLASHMFLPALTLGLTLYGEYTLIALSLGYIVAGAILIETVFSWPGIGRAVYEAVLQRDYPMLQGAFLVLTLSVIFFNLVADLLYFRLDPRITE